MSAKGLPLEDLIAEADRVMSEVKSANVSARLAGGLAIRYLCPSAREAPLSRNYVDLDLAIAGHASHRPLTQLMTALGYEPDAHFNAINGRTRLYYLDRAHGRHVDVFVDAVRMCHVIEFKHRLGLLAETLTPTDLLLSKLQVVQQNQKDLVDAIALLCDLPLEASANHVIDSQYLETVWGNDWPLWRTSQLSIGKIKLAVPGLLKGESAADVMRNLSALGDILDSGHKSLRWRLRARIGDRIRWYELPEEVN